MSFRASIKDLGQLLVRRADYHGRADRLAFSMNPGGPGGSGLELSSILSSYSPGCLFVPDIIGFDPLESQRRAEFACGALDERSDA